MRTWIILAAMLATATPATAADSVDAAAAALTAKVDKCFDAQAPDAVRYATSLTDAVSFLESDICASEVAVYQRYVANSAILKSWQSSGPLKLMGGGSAVVMGAASPTPADAEAGAAKQQAALRQTRVDPNTGELLTPQDAPLPEMFEMMTRTMGLESFGGLPDVRVSAAQAVIAAKRSQAQH